MDGHKDIQIEGWIWLLKVGLTIAAKFIITIVIDSQKYYYDRLSIVAFAIAILSR